MRLSVAGIRRN
jgi:hypothetical protein